VGDRRSSRSALPVRQGRRRTGTIAGPRVDNRAFARYDAALKRLSARDVHRELVEQLTRLRAELGAAYHIHANCWPRHELVVQRLLKIPNESVRHLHPLPARPGANRREHWTCRLAGGSLPARRQRPSKRRTVDRRIARPVSARAPRARRANATIGDSAGRPSAERDGNLRFAERAHGNRPTSGPALGQRACASR